MDSKKIALLTVAVCAIGIFALPSTVSLLSGQHTWYDLSAGPNEVPCEKCHADILEEMQSGFNGAHRNLTCAMCHRTIFLDPDYTYASGEGSASSPGKRAHAAAVIECMNCHGVDETGVNYRHDTHDPEYMYGSYYETCIACHWARDTTTGAEAFIAAGGFGLTGRSWDTGEEAAHMEFVLDAINETTLKGANEACIACHTNIAVKLNWTHRRSLEFEVGLDEPVTTDSGVHNWTMSNWGASGTANVTVWGNTTGNGSTSYHGDWPGNVDDIYT